MKNIVICADGTWNRPEEDLDKEHMFHDNKIGPNIVTARHALAIDERRDDFRPTVWKQRPEVDIEQVWFAGCHSDIGGGQRPDPDGSLLSDFPLKWIADEAAGRPIQTRGAHVPQASPEREGSLRGRPRLPAGKARATRREGFGLGRTRTVMRGRR
jgi:uncharacterized protein (DUF2235 family)